MKKELGESLTRVAVYQIVRKYGKRLGLPKLSPEDLRRTYARLAYEAGVPLTELLCAAKIFELKRSFLAVKLGAKVRLFMQGAVKERLGHDKVTTTIRFLGLPIDLEELI
jgi:integrase